MSHDGTSSLSNWYMIDAEDVISAVSPSWDIFARENEGENAVAEKVIGQSLWTFVTCEETSDFLKSILRYCRDNTRDFEMFYKCDSQRMSRVFLMRAYFIEGGSIRVVHDLISMEPKGVREARVLPVHTKQCTQCLAHFDVDKLRAKAAWEGYPTVYAGTFVCEDCRNHVESAMR